MMRKKEVEISMKCICITQFLLHGKQLQSLEAYITVVCLGHGPVSQLGGFSELPWMTTAGLS